MQVTALDVLANENSRKYYCVPTAYRRLILKRAANPVNALRASRAVTKTRLAVAPIRVALLHLAGQSREEVAQAHSAEMFALQADGTHVDGQHILRFRNGPSSPALNSH